MAVTSTITTMLNMLRAGDVVTYTGPAIGVGGSGAAAFHVAGGGLPFDFGCNYGGNAMPAPMPAQVTAGSSSVISQTVATLAIQTAQQNALPVIVAGCNAAGQPGTNFGAGVTWTGVFTLTIAGSSGVVIIQSGNNGAPFMGTVAWRWRVTSSGTFTVPSYIVPNTNPSNPVAGSKKNAQVLINRSVQLQHKELNDMTPNATTPNAGSLSLSGIMCNRGANANVECVVDSSTGWTSAPDVTIDLGDGREVFELIGFVFVRPGTNYDAVG